MVTLSLGGGPHSASGRPSSCSWSCSSFTFSLRLMVTTRNTRRVQPRCTRTRTHAHTHTHTHGICRPVKERDFALDKGLAQLGRDGDGELVLPQLLLVGAAHARRRAALVPRRVHDVPPPHPVLLLLGWQALPPPTHPPHQVSSNENTACGRVVRAVSCSHKERRFV
jgi:hypothetical protein